MASRILWVIINVVSRFWLTSVRVTSLFPLAPENCDLNNYVWVFLLILSGVLRLSIKYGLSRFLLSVCCHADRTSIAHFKKEFNSFEKISFYYYQYNRKQASKEPLCCFVILQMYYCHQGVQMTNVITDLHFLIYGLLL